MAEGKSVLLFFTGSYPYGRQEAFIENEIGFLASSFDKVIVFPQSTAPGLRPVPNNVDVIALPQPTGIRKFFSVFFNSAVSRYFWFGLKEVFEGRSVALRLRLLASYVGLARLYKKSVMAALVSQHDASGNLYFYSYWLDRNALTMVMLRDELSPCGVVARAHAFDVYEERNPDGYLPLRRSIFEKIDRVHAISEHAASYLLSRYPAATHFQVSRLGTARRGEAPVSSDEVGFHIVSVSNVIPLKRVGLIAESVRTLARQMKSSEVRWTHFGDGPMFSDLKERVAEFDDPNLKIDLRGGQLNIVVKEFYEANHIDLFINLSETEGIPVSFMEAMSYGVPVFATDVGGVREILDPSCGFLLPRDVTAEDVADRLVHLVEHRDELAAISSRALSVWRERYSADVTYPHFCAQLLRCPA